MSAAPHVWKFYRIGGLDQVVLSSGADLLHLAHLDQKLWVALSCPTKGLELDAGTLDLIDTDKDGRIRAPELIAALQWAALRLKDVGDLLKESESLPLDSIDETKPEGRAVLASARRVLANLGKPEAKAIALPETLDTAAIFSKTRFNGDGVVPPASADDAETAAVLTDILALHGGATDRSGVLGVTREKADRFFAEIAEHQAWLEKGRAPEILVWGEKTAAAAAATAVVSAKIDDYFARLRLADYDARTLAAVNGQESDFLALAAKDLVLTDEEIARLPLARVEAGRPLPLVQEVNPAWANRLATFQRDAVAPLFGSSQATLSAAQWEQLKGKLAAFHAWQSAKAGAGVEKLGAARVQALASGRAQAAVHDLLARDLALEPEAAAIGAVERLVRYRRDMRTLLNNFVSFADFYSRTRLATFQSGVLYLDSRSCELCIRVEDPAAHSVLASLSKVYVAYCDCRRKDSGLIKIAACFTQGDSDYLMVGRNGIYYDRQGRDWDATITRIIDNPISIRQAFWAPYKKFVRMVEEQIAKRAAAADAASTSRLAAAAEATAHVDKTKAPGEPKKLDVGVVAALGVALGAIGTFFATVFTKFVDLPSWQYPLVILGIILAISGPSMLIAWLKLRQRTLGPILDANGWAVNGRVKINIPFGTALTDRAVLPAGAQRSLNDPFEDKDAKRRGRWFVVALLLLVAAALAWGVGRPWWAARQAEKQRLLESQTTAPQAPAAVPAPPPAP